MKKQFVVTIMAVVIAMITPITALAQAPSQAPEDLFVRARLYTSGLGMGSIWAIGCTPGSSHHIDFGDGFTAFATCDQNWGTPSEPLPAFEIPHTWEVKNGQAEYTITVDGSVLLNIYFDVPNPDNITPPNFDEEALWHVDAFLADATHASWWVTGCAPGRLYVMQFGDGDAALSQCDHAGGMGFIHDYTLLDEPMLYRWEFSYGGRQQVAGTFRVEKLVYVFLPLVLGSNDQ